MICYCMDIVKCSALVACLDKVASLTVDILALVAAYGQSIFQTCDYTITLQQVSSTALSDYKSTLVDWVVVFTFGA